MRNTTVENDTTTIAVSRTTKKRLAVFGKFGESYDDIIQNLLRKIMETRSNEF